MRFLDFGHKGPELVILGNFQSEPLGGRIEEFFKGDSDLVSTLSLCGIRAGKNEASQK